LDEESREDFFRLKKVTDNKKKEKIASQKLIDLRGASGEDATHDQSESIFGNEDEEELLF
jgi:hypothetical protein